MKTFKLMAVAALFAIGFVACEKNEDTIIQDVQSESEVPYFFLEKGDSISKDIYRGKPTFKEETTILFSTEELPNRADQTASNPNNYPLNNMRVYSSSGSGVPSGCIPVDLNEGAGGNYIYLNCGFISGTNGIAEIAVIESGTPKLSAEYNYTHKLVTLSGTNLPADLNKNAGGPYLYFKIPKYLSSKPIRQVRIVSSTSSSVSYSGWTKVPKDLNKGAGGKYVYLFYKK